MNNIYEIIKLKSIEKAHFELLLLADETTEAIKKYIDESDVYEVKIAENSNLIAIFALFKLNVNEIEIKNIAVSEEFQSKGIGSFLIHEIKNIARKSGYKTIIVGTTDCSFKQINFYEKNGFSKYAIKKDFFIENYAEPIIENGILLKDLAMFRLKL